MSAKVERTSFSIVVYCDECPTFAEGAMSRARAHELAAEHNRLEHPEATKNAVDQLRRNRKLVSETS